MNTKTLLMATLLLTAATLSTTEAQAGRRYHYHYHYAPVPVVRAPVIYHQPVYVPVRTYYAPVPVVYPRPVYYGAPRRVEVEYDLGYGRELEVKYKRRPWGYKVDVDYDD